MQREGAEIVHTKLHIASHLDEAGAKLTDLRPDSADSRRLFLLFRSDFERSISRAELPHASGSRRTLACCVLSLADATHGGAAVTVE